MTDPRITVLMSTYNRAQYVTEALDSVLSQSLRPSQVIVVNDGSTDDTRQVLEPYMDRIEYIEKENSGKASSLNLALPNITGDYIYIIDDDDSTCPDVFAQHTSLLQARPEVGFTYSCYRVAQTGSEGRIKAGNIVEIPDVPKERLLLRLMEGCFISSPAMLVRNTGYKKVGPFNDRLIRCSDYDFKLRLARFFLGARIAEPSFLRRVHDDARGSASDTFTMQDFDARALKYEAIMFAGLRKDLALSEYLPGTPDEAKTNDLQPAQRRQAFLQRMSVMAQHGLWQEMLEDMSLALSIETETGPLTAEERRIVRTSMFEPTALDNMLSDPRALRDMRQLCVSPLGRQIRYSLAQGLYHTLVRFNRGVPTAQRVRRISTPSTWSFGLAALRLLGFDGLTRALRSKVLRSGAVP